MIGLSYHDRTYIEALWYYSEAKIEKEKWCWIIYTILRTFRPRAFKPKYEYENEYEFSKHLAPRALAPSCRWLKEAEVLGTRSAWHVILSTRTRFEKSYSYFNLKVPMCYAVILHHEVPEAEQGLPGGSRGIPGRIVGLDRSCSAGDSWCLGISGSSPVFRFFSELLERYTYA